MKNANEKIAVVASILETINSATAGLPRIVGAFVRPDGSLEALPAAKEDFQAAVDGAQKWREENGF